MSRSHANGPVHGDARPVPDAAHTIEELARVADDLTAPIQHVLIAADPIGGACCIESGRRERAARRAVERERDQLAALFNALVSAVEDLGYVAKFDDRPAGSVMPGKLATLTRRS